MTGVQTCALPIYYSVYFVTHIFVFFFVFVYVFSMENAAASSSASAETAAQSNNGIQQTPAQAPTTSTEGSPPASGTRMWSARSQPDNRFLASLGHNRE